MNRLKTFANAIQAVRRVLTRVNLTEKADSPEEKRRLMMQCRADFPDELLAWLDATYMLLDTETKYPPLLGTGGNEGSGSYMSGFAQQVASVLLNREWDHALQAALFGVSADQLSSSQTPGHFSPEAAGGPNAASGSEGNVATNPWDYLLLLEGTLLFASASVKRMEQRDGGTLSYPFCVRQVGVGYASATSSDEGNSRAEMWLPLWSQKSSAAELSGLFSEGRAQVGSRVVRTGVDFARAMASLGTDRGITAFQRFAFQQRNGLSYFAIPLGRFVVKRQPQVALINEKQIDTWLDSFRRAASSENAPSRARRALNRLEGAILELCQRSGPVQMQAVLVALGEAEGFLAISPKWREEAYQRPIPLLPVQEWLNECDDHSVEFRLAASLASIHSPAVGNLRQHLEPVDVKRNGTYWSEAASAANNVVWSAGSLERNLVAVFQRRCIEAVGQNERVSGNILIFPGHSSCFASSSDVAAFLNAETDDERISQLVRGLCLLNWPRSGSFKLKQSESTTRPDATFTLLKLCHLPSEIRQTYIPLTPEIARLTAAGRLDDATKLAVRRLVGSSLQPAIRNATRAGKSARRIAAALLFPIMFSDMQELAEAVLAPQSQTV